MRKSGMPWEGSPKEEKTESKRKEAREDGLTGNAKMIGKPSTKPSGNKLIKTGTLKPVSGGKTKMFGQQHVVASKPR